MTAAVLFISFAILLAISTPIAIALGVSSMLALIVEGVDLITIPINIYSSTSKWVLMAIPFFILGGNIMDKAGISKRLIKLADTAVGHRKGGMAVVCVAVACFFAAISGSGPATVAALGMILIPAMASSGYDVPFASSLMATSGAIGVVIPPSITFVVYGSIAGASVGKLFMGGLIPGLLMGIGFAVTALIYGNKNCNLVTKEKASGKERWLAFRDAFWGLLMPVIILGGIYGGIFTPTEAAAFSAVYGLVVGLFVYRELKLKDIRSLFIDSISTSATIMWITANASIFAWVLTVSGIKEVITTAFTTFTGGSTIIFYIIVNIVLLIAGMLLDSTSALYIFTPLFIPVATALGVDLVHLGVVMIVNLAIGLYTPPVGVNLYVACSVSQISLEKILKPTMLLLFSSLIVLLLVTYIPQISMFLPNMLK
ncbi:MAG: TRAP transporter large permease [Peptoniphilaceae bacterium]|jgi:tripartite ATP-independent transporter DctM subunit|nr:TRAP transporter large permease [Bacillota bacterium]